jgi:hypothetical protein
MDGEAKPAEALQSGETGRVQLLRLCLWYPDDRAHATGHCLSAALLHPGCELCHVVECHEPPIDEVSRFRAVYFTNHEDRVQISTPLRHKRRASRTDQRPSQNMAKVPRGRRGLLLYLKWVSRLLSPKCSIDVGYLGKESGLKSDAEVFLRGLLRDGNGGVAGRLCAAPGILRFCKAGSRRAKFASFQETADGVRPIARASSRTNGFRM